MRQRAVSFQAAIVLLNTFLYLFLDLLLLLCGLLQLGLQVTDLAQVPGRLTCTHIHTDKVSIQRRQCVPVNVCVCAKRQKGKIQRDTERARERDRTSERGRARVRERIYFKNSIICGKKMFALSMSRVQRK